MAEMRQKRIGSWLHRESLRTEERVLDSTWSYNTSYSGRLFLTNERLLWIPHLSAFGLVPTIVLERDEISEVAVTRIVPFGLRFSRPWVARIASGGRSYDIEFGTWTQRRQSTEQWTKTIKEWANISN